MKPRVLLENKQLKEDHKNIKDPQARKNIQDDLTKNREEIKLLNEQINKFNVIFKIVRVLPLIRLIQFGCFGTARFSALQ